MAKLQKIKKRVSRARRDAERAEQAAERAETALRQITELMRSGEIPDIGQQSAVQTAQPRSPAYTSPAGRNDTPPAAHAH